MPDFEFKIYHVYYSGVAVSSVNWPGAIMGARYDQTNR